MTVDTQSHAPEGARAAGNNTLTLTLTLHWDQLVWAGYLMVTS